MKTFAFLSILRRHPGLPLRFRLDARTQVPAGYHLTEVKRVTYSTMDCGAMTHRWNETHFELWAPPLAGSLPGRTAMPAGKFLQIIDRVEPVQRLDDTAEARIHARLGDHPASLYDIASVIPADGELLVSLTPDRTHCKAAECQVGELTGGCCGLDSTQSSAEASPVSACGCQAPSADAPEKSICCA